MDLLPIHESPSRSRFNVRCTPPWMGPSAPVEIGVRMVTFVQGDDAREAPRRCTALHPHGRAVPRALDRLHAAPHAAHNPRGRTAVPLGQARARASGAGGEPLRPALPSSGGGWRSTGAQNGDASAPTRTRPVKRRRGGQTINQICQWPPLGHRQPRLGGGAAAGAAPQRHRGP